MTIGLDVEEIIEDVAAGGDCAEGAERNEDVEPPGEVEDLVRQYERDVLPKVRSA